MNDCPYCRRPGHSHRSPPVPASSGLHVKKKVELTVLKGNSKSNLKAFFLALFCILRYSRRAVREQIFSSPPYEPAYLALCLQPQDKRCHFLVASSFHCWKVRQKHCGWASGTDTRASQCPSGRVRALCDNKAASSGRSSSDWRSSRALCQSGVRVTGGRADQSDRNAVGGCRRSSGAE